MDSKTLAKACLVAGAILILASFATAWLMFAMRDGPVGGGAYLLASALLGIGIILVFLAKKTYGRA